MTNTITCAAAACVPPPVFVAPFDPEAREPSPRPARQQPRRQAFCDWPEGKNISKKRACGEWRNAVMTLTSTIALI